MSIGKLLLSLLIAAAIIFFMPSLISLLICFWLIIQFLRLLFPTAKDTHHD